METNERIDCLDRAKKLICEDRAEDYGDFRDNCRKVSRMVKATIGISVTTPDVLMFMVCLKLARESQCHKMDNIDDAVGYLALYAEAKEDEIQ